MDDTTMSQGPTRPFSDLVAETRKFLAIYASFRGLDAETRSDAETLIAAARHPDIDEHEREGIYATLTMMLFPVESLGADRLTAPSAPAPIPAPARP